MIWSVGLDKIALESVHRPYLAQYSPLSTTNKSYFKQFHYHLLKIFLEGLLNSLYLKNMYS